MCGRFAQGDLDAIYSKYRVVVADEIKKQLKPRYNIAPSQIASVIVDEAETERKNRLELMRFGLIPFWAKDEEIGYRLINARSETVSQKPSFKKSFINKRCIVPVTGFYEWERSGSQKIPHYFFPKEENLFALAGIYDTWKSPQGEDILSFSILTTEPNERVGRIHDRMPLILEEDEEAPWLNSQEKDIDFLETLFDPYPAENIDEYEVSRDVNNPRNDTSSLIKKS